MIFQPIPKVLENQQKKDKTEFEFLEVGGIPLGMFSAQKYADGAIQLEKGDLVVLYTDGVTEAMNSSDEFFGDEKLQSIIKRRSSFRLSSYEVAYRDLSASELLDEIRNQVDSFTGDARRKESRIHEVKRCSLRSPTASPCCVARSCEELRGVARYEAKQSKAKQSQKEIIGIEKFNQKK